MGNKEIINSIKKLLYNNYVSNLDESERDIITEKIKELEEESFSPNALNQVKKLLNQIEQNLRLGTKVNPEFSNLIKEFVTTNTRSVRKKSLEKILSFKSKLSFEEINQIALKYGSVDLNKYFEETGNKYSIFLINYEETNFEYQDGENRIEIINKFKADFNFSSSNISALYKQLIIDDTIDIIMVRDNLLNDPNFELIIFHEICHLLEKTGYYKDLEIVFSKEDRMVGRKLQSIANKLDEMFGGWGNDSDHNEIFGGLLFHFMTNFNYDERFSLLGKSMIKNFLDDYTNEFKKIDKN